MKEDEDKKMKEKEEKKARELVEKHKEFVKKQEENKNFLTLSLSRKASIG